MPFDPRAFIRNYLDEARPLGKANELSWLDFKIEWHPMKTEEGKLEFVKDIAALVNTGQESLLVVGVADRVFAFKDQRIADSGYPDASNFQSLVASRISPVFSLEVGEIEYDDGSTKYVLSFVHIAPTHNRPHLVTEWAQKARPAGPGGPPVPTRAFENALFFRRGARTFGPTCDAAPTRTELDAMYFDRPSTYSCLIVRNWPSGHVMFAPDSGNQGLHLPVAFDNLGPSPTSLKSVRVVGEMHWAKHLHPAARAYLDETPVFQVWLRDDEYADLPLAVPVGGSLSLHLVVPLPSGFWFGSDATRLGKRHFIAEIMFEDIRGQRERQRLEFSE